MDILPFLDHIVDYFMGFWKLISFPKDMKKDVKSMNIGTMSIPTHLI